MTIELKREDFISQYPPLYLLNKEDVTGLWDKEEIHLYVHFPFCVNKCDFCYYKSFQIGRSGIPDSYLDLLKKEIELYSCMPDVRNKVIRSIYYGGGTPTLMTEQQFADVTSHIYSHFNIHEDVEFTCEMSPREETTLSYIKSLKQSGVTRLSIGCQSVNDAILTANGRSYRSEDFYKCVELARTAGIYSVNVDIMSGMVDQSMEDWLETVDRICELRPENIAVYKLEIYLNNKLYTKYRNGKVKLISDQQEAQYARQGYRRILEKGYQFADNFSFMTEPKYDHIHRRDVWLGKDMLGIGLSAHSCYNDHIFQNTSRLQEYAELLGQNKLPVFRARKTSTREEMLQRVIFGIKNLRFYRGSFEEEFGVDPVQIFREPFQVLEQEGFIIIHNDYVETTFEGTVFADDIVREFFPEEHKSSMLAHVKRPAL
jgi:oxygen-independent coproporphyrinogen III oxidase